MVRAMIGNIWREMLKEMGREMLKEMGREMLKEVTSGEEGSCGDLGAARQEWDGQRGPSLSHMI